MLTKSDLEVMPTINGSFYIRLATGDFVFYFLFVFAFAFLSQMSHPENYVLGDLF